MRINKQIQRLGITGMDSDELEYQLQDIMDEHTPKHGECVEIVAPIKTCKNHFVVIAFVHSGNRREVRHVKQVSKEDFYFVKELLQCGDYLQALIAVDLPLCDDNELYIVNLN